MGSVDVMNIVATDSIFRGAYFVRQSPIAQLLSSLKHVVGTRLDLF